MSRIEDVIIPQTYEPYLRQGIIEKSNIYRSGLARQDAILNRRISEGGVLVQIPMWERLEGRSSHISRPGNESPAGEITAIMDTGIKLMREKKWTAENLASALAGDSAFDAIASMESDWWIEERQRFMIAVLRGVFDSPSVSATHVFDGGGGALNPAMTIRAKQLLGDNADILTMVIMNSLTHSELQEQNLIETIPNARGEIEFQTYLGYRIIVDDTVPTTETYLVAAGALAHGEGTPVDQIPVEVYRNSDANSDYLVTRQTFIMHIKGISWTGNAFAPATSNPTPEIEDLLNGENWNLVYPVKHVGVVKITHGEGLQDTP